MNGTRPARDQAGIPHKESKAVLKHFSEALTLSADDSNTRTTPDAQQNELSEAVTAIQNDLDRALRPHSPKGRCEQHSSRQIVERPFTGVSSRSTWSIVGIKEAKEKWNSVKPALF